jgi:hypothetical protein
MGTLLPRLGQQALQLLAGIRETGREQGVVEPRQLALLLRLSRALKLTDGFTLPAKRLPEVWVERFEPRRCEG